MAPSDAPETPKRSDGSNKLPPPTPQKQMEDEQLMIRNAITNKPYRTEVEELLKTVITSYFDRTELNDESNETEALEKAMRAITYILQTVVLPEEATNEIEESWKALLIALGIDKAAIGKASLFKRKKTKGALTRSKRGELKDGTDINNRDDEEEYQASDSETSGDSDSSYEDDNGEKSGKKGKDQNEGSKDQNKGSKGPEVTQKQTSEGNPPGKTLPTSITGNSGSTGAGQGTGRSLRTKSAPEPDKPKPMAITKVTVKPQLHLSDVSMDVLGSLRPIGATLVQAGDIANDKCENVMRFIASLYSKASYYELLNRVQSMFNLRTLEVERRNLGGFNFELSAGEGKTAEERLHGLRVIILQSAMAEENSQVQWIVSLMANYNAFVHWDSFQAVATGKHEGQDADAQRNYLEAEVRKWVDYTTTVGVGHTSLLKEAVIRMAHNLPKERYSVESYRFKRAKASFDLAISIGSSAYAVANKLGGAGILLLAPAGIKTLLRDIKAADFDTVLTPAVEQMSVLEQIGANITDFFYVPFHTGDGSAATANFIVTATTGEEFSGKDLNWALVTSPGVVLGENGLCLKAEEYKRGEIMEVD